MGRLIERRIYGSCLLLIIFYVAVLAIAAIHFEDYHLINRGGALLSAIGALAVIWQVLVEERFEISNEIDQAASRSELAPENWETAQRIAHARAAGRRLERMRIVICIAFLVMMGEVLHGWGDVIAKALRPVRPGIEHAGPTDLQKSGATKTAIDGNRSH